MRDFVEGEMKKPRQSRLRDDPKDNEGIRSLVERLRKEADRRVGLRATVEQRWLDDLRAYHGQYDPKTLHELKKDSNRSKSYVNKTRAKTDAFAARLQDLLFPSDDRNWGIKPTPVPEMSEEMETLRDDLREKRQKLAEIDAQAETAEDDDIDALNAQAGPIAEEIDARQEALNSLESLVAKATKASNLMASEIEDQLKSCRYQAKARDGIDVMCKLGTAVMKGPISTGKVKRKWSTDDTGAHILGVVDDNRPAFEHTDIWGFFPDPDFKDPNDGEGVYERTLLSKSGLRKLAQRSDIDKQALIEIIKTGKEQSSLPQHMNDLYAITGDANHQIRDRYQLWEYTGPLEPEEVMLLSKVYEDGAVIEDVEDADLLADVHVRVTFCDNEVLSFALHPMDSQETIYSVVNLHEDEAGPWGFGIPYLMRSQQEILNSAWRLMLDNAGISAGPQIVVNKDVIKPEDNTYDLRPFKLWVRKGGVSGVPGFETYNMTMNQPMLANIIELANRDIDEVTSLPMLAQGEQGSQVTKTFNGMAILMNAANVVFRRIVRNFDDNMTVPNIRRLYDFNMQFSKKTEIKGDYEVDARGASVLMVREMQSNNLMLFAQFFGDHPIYKHWIKEDEIVRQACKMMSLDTAELLNTVEEHEDSVKKEMENQGVDPMIAIKERELEIKQAEIDARTAVAEMDNAGRIQVAELNNDAAMMKLAETLNENEEDRSLKKYISDQMMQSKDRGLATEVAMAVQTGKNAGGSI